MRLFSYWTVRFALAGAALGLWWSFQKGDGPAPNWGPVEQIGQSLAAAVLLGGLTAVPGLVFDGIGWLLRKRS